MHELKGFGPIETSLHLWQKLEKPCFVSLMSLIVKSKD